MVSPSKVLAIDHGFDAWLATLAVTWSAAQREVVRRAYDLSTARGLAAADLLAELRLDYETVAAALLHQAMAAGRLTLPAIEETFGRAIGALVEGVRTLGFVGDLHPHTLKAEGQLENLRKMLLAIAQDIRVVLIKLAIRLMEMRDLKSFPEPQRARIAQETVDIFAPLANRLGIGVVKWELEDLSLRCLEPATYKRLAQALDERRADRERYIRAVVERLQTELRKAGIEAQVFGRAKHIYSIWRKMQRKQLPFDQIFDVRAVRIMVNSIADCYAALGIVHGLWNHIRREFDDYIANPKANGYQSLHTAVVGPDGKTLEVQIRTAAMHQQAELGVAAHWRYKEGGPGQGKALEQQIAWIRKMLDYQDDSADDSDLLERFKAEALQDRVYVITPKGAIVELAQGATPLDFAYHIHTEVGHRCRGAKVNGHIAPLTYELKNGDQVQVLTAKQGAPSRDWLSPHLNYLKTPRARAKVRQWFRQQALEKSIAAGRAELERELKRLGVDIKTIEIIQVARRLNFTRPDELFAAIGYGDITTAQAVSKIQELILPPPPDTLRIARKTRLGETGGEIKVRGVGNLLTHMAKCCEPVPFERIVGFITQGRGVSIHREDCANLLDLMTHHRERVIEVDWGEETHVTYSVAIHIDAYDRPGLLRDVTSVFLAEQANVLGSNTHTDPKTAMAHMLLTLEIKDVEQLSRIMDKIAQIPNIMEVRRKR